MRTLTQFTEATAQLYAVFARYTRPVEILTDGNTIVPSEPGSILSKPLRELQSENLKCYVLTAMTTAGSVDDYRYFLPRILELAVEWPESWLAVEIVLGKLRYAAWSTWPSDEQVAVRAFLHIWWEDALMRFPGPLEIDQLLAGLGLCEELSGYLQTFSRLCAEHIEPRRHLVRLLVWNLSDVQEACSARQPLVTNMAWWEECPGRLKQFYLWLFDASTAALLSLPFSLSDDSDRHSHLDLIDPEWLADEVDWYKRDRAILLEYVRSWNVADLHP